MVILTPILTLKPSHMRRVDASRLKTCSPQLLRQVSRDNSKYLLPNLNLLNPSSPPNLYHLTPLPNLNPNPNLKVMFKANHFGTPVDQPVNPADSVVPNHLSTV